MKTVRFFVLWWAALVGWWVLLVGTNAGVELVAAACAATIGAALAGAARRHGLLHFGFEPVWLTRTLKTPWKVVREFAVVTWALALHVFRIRQVRSAYRAFGFPAGRGDAVSAGRRAVMTLADCLSPNTLPLDMDCERGVVLRHELDPRRASNTLP